MAQIKNQIADYENQVMAHIDNYTKAKQSTGSVEEEKQLQAFQQAWTEYKQMSSQVLDLGQQGLVSMALGQLRSSAPKLAAYEDLFIIWY